MRWLPVICISLLLTACAGSQVYSPASHSGYEFQQRATSQENGPLAVLAAVPSRQETLELTGLDLYEQGIQPVWLKVENRGSRPFWVTHKSVDPDYFSPIEVAYMNRRGFTKESQASMERWFWDSGLDRMVLPGEQMQGFVYTHLVSGTKGFNLEAVGSNTSWDMTFFIEMPGFVADYQNVNFASLHSPDEIEDFPATELPSKLSMQLPCCASSADGSGQGLPFNMAMVATGKTLRRALFRAGWLETSLDDPGTGAARSQYFEGRPPDGVFYKARPDGKERKELRLWITSYQSEGTPVILAQAIHDLSGGEAFSLDPDMNASRDYAIQSFWYGQSLSQMSMNESHPESSIDSPDTSFDGNRYFADGYRSFLWLSDSPVALDDVRMLSRRGVIAETSGETP